MPNRSKRAHEDRVNVQLAKLDHMSGPIDIPLLSPVPGGDAMSELSPLSLRAGEVGGLCRGVWGRILGWHDSVLDGFLHLPRVSVTEEDSGPPHPALPSVRVRLTEELPGPSPVQLWQVGFQALPRQARLRQQAAEELQLSLSRVVRLDQEADTPAIQQLLEVSSDGRFDHSDRGPPFRVGHPFLPGMCAHHSQGNRPGHRTDDVQASGISGSSRRAFVFPSANGSLVPWMAGGAGRNGPA